MKLDSKYFDCIRVKPDQDRLLRDEAPGCEWPGCREPACHRAPRGRGREGEFFNFCLEHVRQYNKSYNYFSGMSDEDVARFQKSALTGHRPTWKMSGKGQPRIDDLDLSKSHGSYSHAFVVDDPFGLFGRATGDGGPREYKPRKPVGNAGRKCLRSLGLDETADADEIKARFKELVKRHHPDHNGGDRSSEDKLREVIQAYNYLKEAGLC